MKYAQQKNGFPKNIYKLDEGDDFDEINHFVVEFKNKKLGVEEVLFEKYKNMDEETERNYHSRTAKEVYDICHRSIRLLNCLAYWDRY